jgi:hypothetical protein
MLLVVVGGLGFSRYTSFKHQSVSSKPPFKPGVGVPRKIHAVKTPLDQLARMRTSNTICIEDESHITRGENDGDGNDSARVFS